MQQGTFIVYMIHITMQADTKVRSQFRIWKKVLSEFISGFNLSTKSNIQKVSSATSAISQALPFDPCLRSHGTRPGKCPLPVAGPRRPRVCGVGPWGSMLCGGTAPRNGPATGETWRPSWTWSLAKKWNKDDTPGLWYHYIINPWNCHCQVCVSEC